MEAVISYAKAVLFFLLFVNLMMQLLKGSSYEKFVHPVCGMILVILIVRPVLGLFQGEEKVLYAAEQKIALLSAQNETRLKPVTEDGYAFAVLEAYKKELAVQLSGLLEAEGLTVIQADFVVAAEEKEFGGIRELTVTAERKKTERTERIELAPIVFGQSKRERSFSAEEIRIKDKLADFYRMDEDNIYVSIKEE